MIVFNQPIRVRSKICVLLYRNSEKSLTDIKSHLKTAFKIKADDEWQYIIKLEKVKGGQDSLIYLELSQAPDTYTSKLIISQNGVKLLPSVWCFSEKSFALYSVLKFDESFNYDKYLLTNIDIEQLKSFKTIQLKS